MLLAKNSLQDEGAPTLATALTTSSSRSQELDVHGCGINEEWCNVGASGAASLAQILQASSLQDVVEQFCIIYSSSFADFFTLEDKRWFEQFCKTSQICDFYY